MNEINIVHEIAFYPGFHREKKTQNLFCTQNSIQICNSMKKMSVTHQLHSDIHSLFCYCSSVEKWNCDHRSGRVCHYVARQFTLTIPHAAVYLHTHWSNEGHWCEQAQCSQVLKTMNPELWAQSDGNFTLYYILLYTFLRRETKDQDNPSAQGRVENCTYFLEREKLIW